MRLSLSVDALSPSLTGIGRYVWELVSKFSDRRAEFESLRFYRNKRWIREPAQLLTAEGVQYPKYANLRYVIPKNIRNAILGRDIKRDIFHAPNYFLPDIVESGVITVHDLSIFKYPETHPLERIMQFERSFQSSISRASHIITVSEAMRHEISQFFGHDLAKITAIPLGVSEKFHPREADELLESLRFWGLEFKKYTLCVSTLEPRKRIRNLLNAYKIIPEEIRKKYPCVIVGGSGWLNDDLKNEIVSAENSGWLKYLGYVPEQYLPVLYSGARVFCYPSMYEGFGLPVVEAMSSGVPVIASNCSAVVEVSRGAAHIVDVDDTIQFSTAIHRLLVDDLFAERLKTSGLVNSQFYNWESCADSTLAVYKSC